METTLWGAGGGDRGGSPYLASLYNSKKVYMESKKRDHNRKLLERDGFLESKWIRHKKAY